jgi:hypothetical protein
MKTAQSKLAVLAGLIVLPLFLFFMGCPASLHPLYSDDTLVFEEKLLGKWYGDDQICQFTRSKEKEYKVKVMDEDGQGELIVHLVKLQDHLFLDLYPGENKGLENTAMIYRLTLAPAHLFMKVDQIDSQLILHQVCFDKILDDDPNVLKHEDISNDYSLITAKTEDIQRVLLENIDNEKIMAEEVKFYRGVPLYSQNDIIFSEKLLGQWQSKEGDIVDCIPWENGYDVIAATNDGKESSFKAYLVRIRQQLYFALFAFELSQAEKEIGLHLCPDRLFRIEQMEPELKLQEVDLFKSMEQGYPQEPNKPSYCIYQKI